jgi:hypothetical protein
MTSSEKIAAEIARRDRKMSRLVADYMSKQMRTVESRKAFFKTIGGRTNSEGKLLVGR